MAGVQVAESVSVWCQTVMSIEDCVEIVVHSEAFAWEGDEGGHGVGFHLLGTEGKS